MILLLKVDEEGFHYCLMGRGVARCQGMEKRLDSFQDRLRRFNKDYDISRVGYLVRNGGSAFQRPVTERTALLTGHIGEVPCLGRNFDEDMKEVVTFCRQRFMASRHDIVCDSAFFSSMPRHARLYAIPPEYGDEGLLRHGRHGIIHEWAMNQLGLVKDARVSKVMTIYLKNGADVVALKDGRPVMTSQGFSAFDGVMSRTGAGGIDTSVLFQMFSAGISCERIRQVLERESGFKAILGESVDLCRALSRRDAQARSAQEIFSYQLLKCAGSCAAILGGLESVVFIGETGQDLKSWARDFLWQMAFLGLRGQKGADADEGCVLTDPGSPLGAYYLECDVWQIMADLLGDGYGAVGLAGHHPSQDGPVLP